MKWHTNTSVRLWNLNKAPLKFRNYRFSSEQNKTNYISMHGARLFRIVFFFLFCLACCLWMLLRKEHSSAVRRNALKGTAKSLQNNCSVRVILWRITHGNHRMHGKCTAALVQLMSKRIVVVFFFFFFLFWAPNRFCLVVRGWAHSHARLDKKLKRSVSNVSGEKYLWISGTGCMFHKRQKWQMGERTVS